ncbi:MAG: DUF5723 family protein [Tannerellaceae bacterium]|nr:DUF5723 family protein [Tannerellaceae bacterium]
MNPAFMPRQGYAGVPGLSSVTVESNANALYLDNLIFDRNGSKVTFLHPSVSSSEFLSNLPDVSNLSANLNLQPISFGFFTKSGAFWSFGIGVKGIVDVNVPKPLFELIKVGFTSENKTVNYQIRDLGMSVNAYSEITAGYARNFLDNKLSVGAKAKLLLGLASLDLNVETLDVTAQREVWTARSKATLKGSGIKATYDEDGLFDSIETDLSGIGGFGLGLDLGAAYKLLNDKLKVSLAFTDLGFISWSGSSSVDLKAPETTITVTPGQDSSLGSDFDFKESFDTAISDIREAINFKESSKAQGRTMILHTTVNAGAEYEIIPDLSAGLLSSTYLGSNLGTELTLSANYNPVKLKWLSAALSYSFMYGEFNTVGAALHLAPSKIIHFFIAGDYLMPNVNSQFLPVNSKSINVQLGLAIPIGKAID